MWWESSSSRDERKCHWSSSEGHLIVSPPRPPGVLRRKGHWSTLLRSLAVSRAPVAPSRPPQIDVDHLSRTDCVILPDRRLYTVPDGIILRHQHTQGTMSPQRPHEQYAASETLCTFNIYVFLSGVSIFLVTLRFTDQKLSSTIFPCCLFYFFGLIFFTFLLDIFLVLPQVCVLR